MLGMQRSEATDVEGAVVRGAVRAHDAGAIDREQDRQVLEGHVVDDLVVRALQEGGVDGDHRLEPFCSETGGERDRVLLGDADVVIALGEALVKLAPVPEPSRIAGVMPTRRASCSAMSHSHRPKTWVKVGLARRGFDAAATSADRTCRRPRGT